LKEGVGGESLKRLPTTSLVEESGIFGKDDDKEKIISFLISHNATSNENLCVIPIVGMGAGELARPLLLSLYTRTRG
jgi:hypothetical protein